jgi:hypothetical protein
MKLNTDDVEFVPISQKSIGKLLKILSSEDNICPAVNKIMENISWRIGVEPQIILCGKVMDVDVVARTILETPIINHAFAYYLVELGAESQTQIFGGCFCVGGENQPRAMSCYDFIDWLNSADSIFDGYYADRISVSKACDDVVHFRVQCSEK